MPTPTRCPECGEWLIRTTSGAVCLNGHGGLWPSRYGVTRAQAARLTARAALPQSHLLASIEATEYGLRALYSIGGMPGIWQRTWSDEGVLARWVHGSSHFVRAAEVEREVLRCLGISEDGVSKSK